ASGRWLKRVLGDIGLSIATRILGLLVAAMGVQFMVTGVTDVVVHSIAPQLSPSKSVDKSREVSGGRRESLLRRSPRTAVRGLDSERSRNSTTSSAAAESRATSLSAGRLC